MSFTPLVKGRTSSVSPNVSSIMDELKAGSFYVPEYQRDSVQWDIPKRSLFIESLINNLTIPPLIVYPEDDPNGMERHQVIDGQQRLTTIRDFVNDGFALAKEDEADYAENLGPLIQGKTFSELPEVMREQIRRYTINLLVLPKNLDLSLRLEIFRRINEGGVPLSPQDLRLAAAIRPLFVKAGWYPNRTVRIPSSISPGHPAASILTQFGGLQVGTSGSGQECATSDVAFGELPPNTVRDLWTRLLRTELIGIAEIHNAHGELYIDREGRYYGASQIHDAFWFEGTSFNEAMERILLGLRSRPMLRPGQDVVQMYGESIRAEDPRVYKWE